MPIPRDSRDYCDSPQCLRRHVLSSGYYYDPGAKAGCRQRNGLLMAGARRDRLIALRRAGQKGGAVFLCDACHEAFQSRWLRWTAEEEQPLSLEDCHRLAPPPRLW